jgi:hypothetical protein
MHQYLPGYLYLRWLSGKVGRTTDLSPDWSPRSQLATLLAVPGGPHPYFRPFWNGARNADQEWLNKNLAGSFAPSSLRDVPLRVIEVDPATKHFNLQTRHWEAAHEHLLFGKQLSVSALAGFFLRNYAVVTEGDPPTREHLIELFRHEWGYLRPMDDQEYFYLYDETPPFDLGEWFEARVEAS